MCDVVELKECGECFDNSRGDEGLNRVHINLHNLGRVNRVRDSRELNLHTFIRALESLPVHWLKFRPCLNLRSPGKGGASAILFQRRRMS